jgi:hypothetical protein
VALRVAVWGTGNVGTAALRAVVANPALTLAGVIVANRAKVGRDAGELCGLGPLGIPATDDVERVLADAVAYCASGDFRPDAAIADVERCVRAGCNVVSTSIYPLYDPPSAPPDLRARMEDACRAGDASLFVSGIDPGFINDVVPLALSGLCETIEEIRAFEIFNYELYEQPDAVRFLVGFGQPLDSVPPMVAPGVPSMVWGGQIRLMARGLGVELGEVREVLERLPLETSTIGSVDSSAGPRARSASRCRAGSMVSRGPSSSTSPASATTLLPTGPTCAGAAPTGSG